MKREMLIHKEEELSMEIDKYIKIGKQNTINSAIAILLNILSVVVGFAMALLYLQIQGFFDIPQKIEEIIEGLCTITLAINVYSLPTIACMVIFSLLAFLLFALGRKIAQKKTERIFGFAIVQLLAMSINLATHIAQCCFMFFLLLLIGCFLSPEDSNIKTDIIWQVACRLIFFYQCCYGLGVFALLVSPLMNLKTMIKNECERRRLKEIADLNETPWRMKD